MTQTLRSATIFSLAAEPPAAGDASPHAALDAATLADDARALSCTIHKLSTAGATLHIDTPLDPDSAMRLDLANGQSIPGTVAWSENGQAGLAFAEPLDIIGTLARNLVGLPAERRTMPRVEIAQTVCVKAGRSVEHARTRNISQGGAGIETRLDLAVDQPVQLIFDTLRPLDGTVRWVAHGQAGIAFAQELGWQTLMPWLRHAQRNQVPVRTAMPVGYEPDAMIKDKLALQLDAAASVREEGGRWWNARIRGLTAHQVELETQATIRPGTQLWISLPGIGGCPAAVVQAIRNRILCDFRLPLQPRDLRQLGALPRAV